MKKFVSWNVNGLRAILGKGFVDIVNNMDADIFCLQETKMQEGQAEIDLPQYNMYFNYAEKKGYSGTAVFTKEKPVNVTYGIGIEEHDKEGRVITLEFSDYYFCCVYVPNSQNELKRLSYRMEWEDAFREYLCNLKAKKHVILTGDLNVAHEEIDLKNPKANTHNAGFTKEEREKFTLLLGEGFHDTFRELYPETQTFSWWSYRFNARARNAGWRIDYFVTDTMDFVKDSIIHTEIEGSDHCPVELICEL